MLEMTFLILCALGALTFGALKAADAVAWLTKAALVWLRRRIDVWFPRDVWFPEPYLGEAVEAPAELRLEDNIRLVALAAILQREATAR